jgi:para-nitrobenzyl esterase
LTTVQTTDGKIEGLVAGGVLVFKGIPFAGPPVGALRLRGPIPVEAWTGVRSAADYGAKAPQNPPASALWGAVVEPQDEDCLTLNVWTPGVGSGSRPVMVWMHGGAFVMGTGASPLYEGSRLASRGDVVIVTINYRLGILGFAAHRDLADDAAGGAAGSWGLLDQVAALRWVRDNIAAFGGDPNNVTIFGESAGAASVADLLVMPAAKGLFRKAIIQSGAPGAVTIEDGEQTTADVLAELGIARPEQLRDRSVEDLLAAQAALIARRGVGRLPFVPAVDGAVFTQAPIKALAAGSAAGIPVLIGTNRDEAKAFLLADPKFQAPDEEVLRSRIERSFRANDLEPDPAEVIAGYRTARAERGDAVTPRDIWAAIESDRIFRNGALRAAEVQSQHESRTFMYLFDWESPALDGALGASHAVELPFVWGNLDAPRMDTFGGSGPAAEALSQKMMDAWLAFARTANPSTASLGEWPAFEPALRATMILGAKTRVEHAPYEAERRLWESGVASAAGKVSR